jgi:flagellar hook-associated protein 1 FlgK
MPTFTSLNTALTGLQASRLATEVIAHNIANVNTTGYTRRRLLLAAEAVGTVPAAYSRSDTPGHGVRVVEVTRMREAYLDAVFRDATAAGAASTALASALQRAESVFPEPSDDGLAHEMAAFWDTWASVANDPGSLPARTSVLEQARSLTDGLHDTANRLYGQREALARSAVSLVDRVNDLATKVADLNTAIQALGDDDLGSADLLDERDRVLDELSELIDIQVRTTDGLTSVSVGASALVAGSHAERLAAVDVADPALSGLGLQRVEVQWELSGRPATISGGEVAGVLSAVNDAVPDVLRDLDAVAASLVSTVNSLHTAGQALDGSTGWSFFDPAATTARTVVLSADVDGVPEHLAAATLGAGALDAGIARALSSAGGLAGGPDEGYVRLVADLGTATASAMRRSSTGDVVLARAHSDRQSLGGVDIDEEMVALVSAQHAYSASARVMTAVDEMLDVLINRTGVVGR